MAGPREDPSSTSIWHRLGWFTALWAGSIVALSIVAYGLKWAVKIPG